MKRFFKQNLLPLTVFVTGACVLIVEIVAVRVLSPHYGTTIFTVSSVISVILAALSLGYYAGGKFADKYPSLKNFFLIILASGFAVLIFHFLGVLILPMLSGVLSIKTGPMLSSLILFFLPALLLGTLSPYAVKLQSLQMPDEGIGSVAGRMFFWSTLGSIVGSLLAGFVLIPRFGIDNIFIGVGVSLFLLGFLPLQWLNYRRRALMACLMVIVLFSTLLAVELATVKTTYSQDGVYEKISIFDSERDGRPVRYFQQDRSNSGAMFLDSDDATDLVFDYTDYYRLYKLMKPDTAEALVIGGGAYSLPKALLAELPEATIDVSEIEPSLYDLAKEYFLLQDDPRLHNYTVDGRRFLRDSDKQYDMIFSDVYYSLYSVPSHFTTQEFFALAKSKLSEDGIFIGNFIGDLSQKKPSLIMTEIKTFRSVFPNSYFFAVRSPEQVQAQNIIFVGWNSNTFADFNGTEFSDNMIDVDSFDLTLHPIFTDNYAPAEYFTAKVIDSTY